MDRNPDSPWNPRMTLDLTPAGFEKQVLEWLRATATRQQQEIDAQHRGVAHGAGGDYEIDVLVTFKLFAGAAFIVLVECKHQSRPVEREDVLALDAKTRAVNAHKAMLFSTSGFQSGAQDFATAQGIATVTVVEGGFVYNTRAAGTRPVAPPPWANIQPYAGILTAKAADGRVLGHTFDLMDLDAIEEWLVDAQGRAAPSQPAGDVGQPIGCGQPRIDAALRIGAVHIIESLGPGDRPTGERLFDQLRPLAESVSPPIPVHFWREPTRHALLDRLQHIAADVRLTGRAPVVQLEAHGDAEAKGLRLTSGEVVTWADLKAPLTAINVLCRLNLLVMVAACNGADLTYIIRPNERAPVWGLIGPLREVLDAEIAVAHTAFYRTLFLTGDGGEAWRAMNAATGVSGSRFHFIGAEWMFREVMRTYFKEECSDDRLAQRTHMAVELANERARSEGKPEELLPLLAAQFAAKIDAHLRDYQRFFDQAKERFFLIDLCPEHATRFKVSLADCLDT
jgi:restriction system protein